MKDIYKISTRPIAMEENQIRGERYRITMLTEGLIRLEYSEDGIFEDRPTQMALYRDFPKTEFHLIRSPEGIEIHTSRIQLIYNEKAFSANGLSIQVKGKLSAYHSIWRFGEPVHDLGGTARTLDLADGAVELDHGVVSTFGYSLLDDSRSQVLLEDGWLEPRKKGIQDLYFFGYGHDYKQALRDFYFLCGKTPMLPRYALGNWWSRFYPYTEKSYTELMDRFAQENLPFTVAIIDTEWHLMDIDEKYGSGWTGYTWNREYFPEPERFLGELHRRGIHTALNVHPAEGVKAHEEMYMDMAKAMGVDYTKEDPVNCDLADPKFIEQYFTYLHHPREKEGVDFWWIDWQQGTNCKVEGLDPLWILNHYHFLDNGKDGKRPMTFSRYAGPGSHRYPVGFSGDTIVTWESLDFQPYFTVNATNIGFGWWSHDIGGHMMGYKDDELVARWTQFGVYSPIMRLHSSRSEFNGKEPWRFKKETENVMGEALRQRHRMIPYLYSMNYRSYQEDLPLMEPMYYEYPEEQEAYQVKNQYYFGSELLVAPITAKRVEGLNVAGTKVWLPEGLWYDIETGMMYEGGRSLMMYRDIFSIPVLAKAGGILPLTEEISAPEAGKNPDSLKIQVYAGADGEFTLYEDDNLSCDYLLGTSVKTRMTYREICDGEEESGDEAGKREKMAGKAVFTVEPAVGEYSLIPKQREITVELTGFLPEALEQVNVILDGKALDKELFNLSYLKQKQAVVVWVEAVRAGGRLEISLPLRFRARKNAVIERIFAFLNQAEISFEQKDEIYRLVQKEGRIPVLLAQLSAMDLDKAFYEVLMEILTGMMAEGSN